MTRTNIAVALATPTLLLVSCGSHSNTAYTLYRNSPLALSDRVWFATFDADESAEFNGENCAMAARLLDANVAASAKAEGKTPIEGAGFWCEQGNYSEEGQIPRTFDSAFPATSDGPLSW